MKPLDYLTTAEGSKALAHCQLALFKHLNENQYEDSQQVDKAIHDLVASLYGQDKETCNILVEECRNILYSQSMYAQMIDGLVRMCQNEYYSNERFVKGLLYMAAMFAEVNSVRNTIPSRREFIRNATLAYDTSQLHMRNFKVHDGTIPGKFH